MELGIAFANTLVWGDSNGAILGQCAEELGYDSLWTVEHVVLPAGYKSPYPYSKDGQMPGGEDASIPDPIVWLSYVAASTSNIKLGTGIVILPQRNPILFAKEIATLDVVSNGRVLLGIGVGWLKEEFEALGVPFENRAKRTDEHIGALRAIWRNDSASFHGELVNFDGMKSNPKPIQKDGVPIVVGGHSSAAAKRAGRLGDGFFPAIADVDKLTQLVVEMKAAALDAGRDPEAIEITFGASFDAGVIRHFRDLGVKRLVVPPLGRDAQALKTFLGNTRDTVESALN
ncbi:MAG: LLM class F420-dependent oxidoreductase [Acidimicrobiales bacterium]|nr:LLM class F420-dependent oxidoreductase [Acidimicrobiales bacterium]